MMIKIRDKVRKIKGAIKNKSTYKFSTCLPTYYWDPCPHETRNDANIN